jgi:GT2 family glycosyltransferase
MKTTVVIPVGQEWYLPRLQNCLRSVWNQTVSPFEVIVVYVHLPHEEVPLRQLEDEIARGCRVVVQSYEALGFPTALSRNVGIRRAEGDVVLTVDADTYLHPQSIEVSERKLLREAACFIRFRTRMMPHWPDSEVFRITDAKAYERRAIEGKWAPGPGCVIAARTEDLHRVRGWDESFVGYGPVVLDVCARLRHSGLRERVFPKDVKEDICCMHQHHDRVRDQGMTTLRKANIARYQKTLRDKDFLRNPHGWGGVE